MSTVSNPRGVLLALAVLSVALPALAEKRGSGWVAPAPAAEATEALKATLAEADRLYDTRHESGNDAKALELLRAAGKENPASFDVQWRLARACFWTAETIGAKDQDKRRAVAKEGWEAGKRAVAAKPKAADGHYWLSLNVGEYSHSVGIITALTEGIEDKFRDPLVQAEKLDPSLDHGGVFNALGRYKFELPWPKRDLKASVEYLRKSVQVNPQNLRGRAYLADALWDRDDDGDRAEAKKLLDEVDAAPSGRYDAPEELRAKSIAKAIRARISK